MPSTCENQRRHVTARGLRAASTELDAVDM